MTIGIIGAIHEEIAALKEVIEVESVSTIGLREYTKGKLFGKDCVLVFSRWGKVAASTTASILIERFRVEKIIFSGLAGAITDEVQVGDIIIGDNCVQYDVDLSPLTGTKYEIPLLGFSKFPLDEKCAEIAFDSSREYLNNLPQEIIEDLSEFDATTPKVHKGTIASGGRFISTAKEKEEIKKGIPKALCVEMEGAAVAQIGYEYTIPVVVIRIISDRSDCSAAEDFSRFSEKVATPFIGGIIKSFFEHCE